MDTPFAKREVELEPLYISGEEYSSDDEWDAKGKDSEQSDIQTPEKPDVNSNLFDENTPTPRPNKSRHDSLSSQDSGNVKQAENETDKQELSVSVSSKVSSADSDKHQEKQIIISDQSVSKPVKPQLSMKCKTTQFSPFRPSSLYKSTTWADIVEEEARVKTSAAAPTEQPSKAQFTNSTNQSANAFKKPPITTVYATGRSVKPLTVPKEFNFSQRRPRTKLRPEQPVAKKEVSHKPTRPLGITRPKPFKFHTRDKPVEADPEKSPYVPLAERVKQFEKTPDRYKINTKDPVKRVLRKQLTIPKSPNFQTTRRIRREKVLSHEEQELERIKAHQKFKAKPTNQRVLHSHGDIGVPRLKKTGLTIPKSPNFSKPRARQNTLGSRLDGSSEPINTLKDRKKPLGFNAARSAVAHQNPVKKHGLTRPKSPALSTKTRGEYYREIYKNGPKNEQKSFGTNRRQGAVNEDSLKSKLNLSKNARLVDDSATAQQVEDDENPHIGMNEMQQQEIIETLKAHNVSKKFQEDEERLMEEITTALEEKTKLDMKIK